MADEKPKTVKVESTEWHTYNGTAYDVGDTYDAPADLVDSLEAQGKATRVDSEDVAKPAKAAKEVSTPVEPMTTKTRSSRALAKPAKKRKR